jgi:HSP20 family protein
MFKMFKKGAGQDLTNAPEKTHGWLKEDFEEGQLSIDVYETEKNIVIKSTIAGAKPDDLDITIDNDMLTIRGKRHDEEEKEGRDYLYQECYWGSFSRSVILPVEVDPRKIDASLENGVLTVTLKKIKKAGKVGVKVKS